MNNDEALQILREFVADVMAANNNDYDEAVDDLKAQWFDLSVTFQKAFELVEKADA